MKRKNKEWIPEYKYLPRQSRSKYMIELIMEDIGKVYGFDTRMSEGDTFVRLKFRNKKVKGGFGWDSDRHEMHVYSSREQKHKMFRCGWWFNMCRKENEPLYNLKQVRFNSKYTR